MSTPNQDMLAASTEAPVEALADPLTWLARYLDTPAEEIHIVSYETIPDQKVKIRYFLER